MDKQIRFEFSPRADHGLPPALLDALAVDAAALLAAGRGRDPARRRLREIVRLAQCVLTAERAARNARDASGRVAS